MNIAATTFKARLIAVFKVFNHEFVLETHGKLLDRSTWHPMATLRLERDAPTSVDTDYAVYWFGPLNWTWCKLPPRHRNTA